jgi:hypothetical protein
MRRRDDSWKTSFATFRLAGPVSLSCRWTLNAAKDTFWDIPRGHAWLSLKTVVLYLSFLAIAFGTNSDLRLQDSSASLLDWEIALDHLEGLIL